MLELEFYMEMERDGLGGLEASEGGFVEKLTIVC